MDFTLDSWTDLATFSVIMASALGFIAWLARTWINQAVDRVSDNITPHLTNDDTSVAKYAHQARDAAELSKLASLDAKSAALDAKSAALEAGLAVEKVSLAVEKIDQRLTVLTDLREGKK